MHPQIILTLNPQGIQLQVPPGLNRDALVVLLLDTVKAVATSAPTPSHESGIQQPPPDVAKKLLEV